jgi:hypothetical protein
VDQREDKQPLVKTSAVVGAGLASTAAAFFTSRFGVAGTVIGAALTTMIITAGSALFGVYLERAAARARGGIPSVVRARPPRRRSILLGGLLAAAASFAVGMGAVTGVELGVGKSLSCWVWDECPTKDDGGGGTAPEGTTQTRPSILGGGQKSVAPAPQPGGVVQPRQTAPPREQGVPDATSTPRGRPGGVALQPRNEAREGVPPQQAPGGRQPAQERPGVTPPDGEAPEESPSAAPGGSERPVPSDDRPADRPPAGEQPGRPSSWVHEQRPT